MVDWEGHRGGVVIVFCLMWIRFLDVTITPSDKSCGASDTHSGVTIRRGGVRSFRL